MRILIETIPHSEQDYNTVGNYKYLPDGTLYITISELGDLFLNKLVAVHEMVEQALTEQLGISEEEITKFDIDFENNREEGNLDEPGYSPLAPYHREHEIASAVELMMCAHADVSFSNYDKIVNEL